MSSSALSTDNVAYLQRLHRTGGEPSVLADIYKGDINLAVWHRQLDSAILAAAERVVQAKPSWQLSVAVSPEDTASVVGSALGEGEHSDALTEDIQQLVDMFCCLFDLKRVGLRLSTLDRAMCSRFHVDIVPCRLVTTYCGVATEWLAEQHLDRRKLGRGNNGKADEESGLYQCAEQVQELGYGDVALLKGEHWEGNKGGGLVHRSPAMRAGTRRLLMTLDFMDD